MRLPATLHGHIHKEGWRAAAVLHPALRGGAARLLVVSLALVGAMMILWGGPQSSELPLRPPPEAQHPAGPPTGSGPQPPGAPREQAGAAVPASARSTASVTSGSSSGPSSSRDDPPELTVPPVLTSLLR
jgi:hypothetical protein